MLIAKFAGIDLDDTLFDFIGGVVDFHNEKYGTKLKKEDMTSYDFWDIWGGTREEAIAKVAEFQKTGGYRKLVPLEGAIEGINFLYENHYNLLALTSRNKNFHDDTQQSLKEFFPNKFFETYYSNHWHPNGDFETKAEICQQYQFNIIIEDHIGYALECAPFVGIVFLFNRPWNKKRGALPSNVFPVDNWWKIINFLKNKAI